MMIVMRKCVRCKGEQLANMFVYNNCKNRICKGCHDIEKKAKAKALYEARARDKYAYERMLRKEAQMKVAGVADMQKSLERAVAKINPVLFDWGVDQIQVRPVEWQYALDRYLKGLMEIATEYRSFTRSNRNELLRMNRVMLTVTEGRKRTTEDAINKRVAYQVRAVQSLRNAVVEIITDRPVHGVAEHFVEQTTMG